MGSIEDDPRQVWHSSQSADGSNYVGYQSPEADALIEQIRAEFDEGKRQALYRRLNAKIVEDQPYVLLFHQPKRTLVSRRLRGVYESPIESYQVRDVWIAAP
jgi:peptide/nickel transport system substrate-binding protein